MTSFELIVSDLWIMVMENLDPVEDKKTLIAASLTCRAWTHPSQSSLFRYCQLTSKRYFEATPSSTSAKFAKNVRYLRLCDKTADEYGRPAWPGSLENLERFLGMCTGVIVLNLAIFDWQEVRKEEVADSLLSNTRRQDMERLCRSLSSVRIIIVVGHYVETIEHAYLLNCFPQIKSLIIDRVHYYKKHTVNLPPQPTFSLETLMIREVCGMTLLLWLKPALKGLKNLTLTRDAGVNRYLLRPGPIEPSFIAWLHEVGQSVEHLTLEMSQARQLIHPQDTLSLILATPNIKSLGINGLRYGQCSRRQKFLTSTVQSLAQLVSKLPVLEQLVFDGKVVLGREDITNEKAWEFIFPPDAPEEFNIHYYYSPTSFRALF